MTIDRRSLITAGIGVTLTAAASHNATAGSRTRATPVHAAYTPAAELGLDPSGTADQTAALQKAIDRAHVESRPLLLPPGRFVTGPLRLAPGTRLVGSGQTTLVLAAEGSLLSARGVAGLVLTDLWLEATAASGPILALKDCAGVDLSRLDVDGGGADGINLERVTGRIEHCRIARARHGAIHSVDARGLTIASNEITACGDNGILVWRSSAGHDGTLVTGNRIARIAAESGGSGQNGNGINVFRAGSVTVSGNSITDCAYSAIRGNAASNLLVSGNSCAGLGEVAIYAEFGFEGAVVTSNSIDTAASGIAITNFDQGGRLAVVQGNLVRNLFRREHEAIDTRGHGITVEADAAVSGNTIEGAPSAGLMIGWGPFMRDVAATGNVIRASKIGILISADARAGACLVTGNLISGATDGAIRAMEHGRPVGPDLAQTPGGSDRLVVAGNMAV
ncbi:MAG: TIGR03808 family TAT-translocated repetitive protein [Hyphomicrobiaceae bacterium]|nr:TIGR03808 family TAT-translocated repetitive protein [Hyphomicrobiaceae bacterium]